MENIKELQNKIKELEKEIESRKEEAIKRHEAFVIKTKAKLELEKENRVLKRGYYKANLKVLDLEDKVEEILHHYSNLSTYFLDWGLYYEEKTGTLIPSEEYYRAIFKENENVEDIVKEYTKNQKIKTPRYIREKVDKSGAFSVWDNKDKRQLSAKEVLELLNK